PLPRPLAVSTRLLLILFLVLPRPPRSTLFPYTTLFRSSRGPTSGWTARRRGEGRRPGAMRSRRDRRPNRHRPHAQAPGRSRIIRSEEHTSELQSPYDLVCRLLLEKKKNKQPTRGHVHVH